MIVDCFTFFDELDLLELRLQILDAVVDRFVICEAPFTFRGEPKPLTFANNAERFARWRDRIVALTYPNAASENPWVNEWGQRDFLIAGLVDCADDDLILIGDCDEIPDPANVARRPARGGILAHRQRYSAGFVNRVVEEPWIGTRSLAKGDIARYHSLSDVRKRPLDTLEYVDGGWHFTSLGGAASQAKKFRSASHLEVDLLYYRDIRKLEVTFAADVGGRQIPLDDSFPAPLHTDPRWSPYIWNGPALFDPTLVAALEHAHGCFAYIPDTATSVSVITGDPGPWNLAGRDRFAAIWQPAAPHVIPSGVEGQPQSPQPWIVVDHLERYPAALLADLHNQGYNVVVYAGNARSFATGRMVLAGDPYPPGPALGRPEYEARIGAAGYTVSQTDRLRTGDVFVAWPSMPEVMYGVSVGPLTIAETPREDLRTFLSDAFIFVLSP